MTDAILINSTAYWDGRFVENWEGCQGPAQSRFFARLAIEHLPRWLVDQIRRQSLTVCDWGCAQGDGTDVWAGYMDPRRLTGVDFSSVAIDQAARRYPAIRFVSEDWLAQSSNVDQTFDLVFSSNTLEHFHEPYEVLDALCRRARKGLILALPYREMERIDEHFFTFLSANIPLVLRNGFRLVWSQVVDCRSIPGTLWDGDQILLVYADPGWVDLLGLTLRDGLVSQEDSAAELVRLSAVLAERDGQLADLNQVLAERDGQLADLNQTVADRDGQIASLNQAVTDREVRVTELSRQLQQLVASRSWRLTRPLRILGYLIRAPLSTSNHLARRAYDRLATGPLKTVAWRFGSSGVLGCEDDQANLDYLIRSIPRRRIETWPDFEAMVLSRRSEFKGVFIQSATIPWDMPLYQRPQHIAVAFGKLGYLVIYRSTLELEGRDMQVAEEIAENVWLTGFQQVEGIAAAVTSYYSTTYWHTVEEYIASAMQGPVIYEYIDHIDPAITGASSIPMLRQLQKFAFFGGADYIVASGRILEEETKCAIGNDRVLYVPNGVDTAHYEAGLTPRCTRNLPRHYRDFIRKYAAVVRYFGAPAPWLYWWRHRIQPRRAVVGYFGALAPWLWYSMLRELVTRRPDLGFVFIGPDYMGAAAQLPQAENVLWLGPVDYKVLPCYAENFDVAIIPFEPGDIARTTSPLKLFEYFALGKPVVVTAEMQECTVFKEVLAASSATGFSSKINEALALSRDPTFNGRLLKLARENDWTTRARAMEVVFSRLDTGTQTPMALLNAIQQAIIRCYRKDDQDRASYYETTYSKEEMFYWLPVLSWLDGLHDIENVADIGAAYGTLLLYTISRHTPAMRIAVGPAQHISHAFVKENGVDYVVGDFERQELLSGRHFDLVIFTEVLEHLNFAPGPTLKRIWALLTSGGWLLLTTPDAEEWGRQTKYYECLADIPPYHGQQDQWIDDHIWRYSKSEVDDILRTSGFSVEAFSYAPGVVARHLCYLCRKRADHAASVPSPL